MTFPEPNTLYRIRSVDFNTCLQLWDVDANSVVMRLLKETNLQQWLFVKEGTDDKYKIMAAATQSLRRPVYLYIDKRRSGSSASEPPKAVTKPNASLWELYKDTKSDGSYVLSTSGDDDHDIFLSVNEDGKLDSVAKESSNNPTFNPSMRWEIVEYWPSVPRGTYRIRTLDGTALNIDPGFTKLSVAPMNKSRHQEWSIEPKWNGKCTISSTVNTRVFLAWKPGKDDIAEVSTSDTPIEWFIRSIGEFTYCFTFGYAVDNSTTLTLALSSADEEVLLKPRKVTHGQIWFLEGVTALPSGDKPPPYSSSTRELNAGLYYPRNVQLNQYITFNAWNWVPSARTYTVKVTYIDNTNFVKLSYGTCFIGFPNNSPGVGTIGRTKGVEANAAAAWVLERVTNSSAGTDVYYVCLSSNRSVVLSGETVANEEGVAVFTVAAKNEGSNLQHWKFEK